MLLAFLIIVCVGLARAQEGIETATLSDKQSVNGNLNETADDKKYIYNDYKK